MEVFIGEASTCLVNQTIENEEFVLRLEPDTTVEGFEVSKNNAVQFLPRHIGATFPNLKDFMAWVCGLTIVRDFYFANMRNTRYLILGNNKIAAIEPNSFKDLVNVNWLHLGKNKINTSSLRW